jgi:3-methyladenine DNA glycosylase AlkD
MSYTLIQKKLKKLGTKERAEASKWFFKTGPGEYGEGDVFIGITVPVMRTVAKEFEQTLTFSDIETLIHSKIHEERFVAIIVLVQWYKNTTKEKDEFKRKKIQKKIFTFYMKHVSGVNNWDLVDASAYEIVGPYISDCMTHEQRLAFINTCIASKNMWVNRIIIVASFYQIKKGNEKMTFYIAERLLGHPHDLIHKAIGWMLREVGKNCGVDVLELFLKAHIRTIPRTTLRYAIERFPQHIRRMYLNKKNYY